MQPIHALLFDGTGSASASGSFAVPPSGTLWIHLDLQDPGLDAGALRCDE